MRLTFAQWNAGNRPDRDIYAGYRDIVSGNVGPGGRPFTTAILEGSDIVSVLRPLGTNEGQGFILAPDGEGRQKNYLLYDEGQATPKGDLICHKTADAFGQYDNRWVVGSEFNIRGHGASPIVTCGHEVPHNEPQARKRSIDNVARYLESTKGRHFHSEDWNTTPETSQAAAMRDLHGFGLFRPAGGTFGKRCIDWAVARGLELVDVEKVNMPGQEHGGGEHFAVFWTVKV